jgi:hypothetical protein
MPTASQPLKPLPQPNVPLIDVKTGLPTQALFEWLDRLQATLTKVRSEIP